MIYENPLSCVTFLQSGCLDSWQKTKEVSYEEEKKRIEDELRRKEEEARRRKEEEEQRKREEEERRRKEEEERKRVSSRFVVVYSSYENAHKPVVCKVF